MHVLTRCAAAVLAGVGLAGGTSRAGAQTSGRNLQPDAVQVTLSGSVHGALPPAPCTVAGGPAGTVAVGAFDETTASTAPAGSGTFELEIATACAAPFYQALFSHEPITAAFVFGGAQRLTLSLANARITHVDVIGSPRTTSTLGLTLKIGIASTQVTASAPGANVTTGTAPSASPTTSSPAKTAAVQSGVVVPMTKGASVALSSGPVARIRAPSIHATSTALAAAAPVGAGDAWTSHGVIVNAHLVASTPALDAMFPATGSFLLAVHATVDAVTGMPTSTFQITLGPLKKAQDAATGQLKSAALAHAALTQAIITLVGSGAAPGLTVWLKSAHLTDDALSASSESISVAATQLTITDISSGRTASSP